MQDHPIPQAVTSYEFHLIGNMTLKQFLELAGGILIGVVLHQTNLPDIIKWPMIVFFVGLGAMIAFVPYEGRPLDQWFIALFRAIYKPTQFFWQKSGDLPGYFTHTAKDVSAFQQEVDLSPLRQQRIYEYIHTLPSETQLNPLDLLEQQQVSSIMTLFDAVQVTHVEAVESFSKPNLTSTPHSLKQYEDLFTTPNTPVQEERLRADQIPEVIPPIIQVAPEPIEQVVEEKTNQIVDVFNAPIAPSQTPSPTTDLNIKVVTTSQDLPFPQKPNKPNLVVGMVFDQYGNIVENAIVEIEDDQGMPVRAVKTNKIGQFFISTPLKNGEYFMKAEKGGILFPTQKLVLDNTIIDPIEIRATDTNSDPGLV